MQSQSTRATRYNGDLSLEEEDVGEVGQLNLFRSRHGDALGGKKIQGGGKKQERSLFEPISISCPQSRIISVARTERPRLVDSRNPANSTTGEALTFASQYHPMYRVF